MVQSYLWFCSHDVAHAICHKHRTNDIQSNPSINSTAFFRLNIGWLNLAGCLILYLSIRRLAQVFLQVWCTSYHPTNSIQYKLAVLTYKVGILRGGMPSYLGLFVRGMAPSILLCQQLNSLQSAVKPSRSPLPNSRTACLTTSFWPICCRRPLSAQIWLYQRQKVRGGELSLPSEGRPAMY